MASLTITEVLYKGLNMGFRGTSDGGTYSEWIGSMFGTEWSELWDLWIKEGSERTGTRWGTVPRIIALFKDWSGDVLGTPHTPAVISPEVWLPSEYIYMYSSMAADEGNCCLCRCACCCHIIDKVSEDWPLLVITFSETDSKICCLNVWLCCILCQITEDEVGILWWWQM